MSSLKSKLILSMVRNRHLFQYPFKREVITKETSTIELRKKFEESAGKFGGIPDDVKIAPVTIQGLPEGLNAEWIYPAGSADMASKASRAIFIPTAAVMSAETASITAITWRSSPGLPVLERCCMTIDWLPSIRFRRAWKTP